MIADASPADTTLRSTRHAFLNAALGTDRVIPSDTLYRCLDKLVVHKRAFFSFLRARWTTLFDARFDVLLYDLTSTYFESDPPSTASAGSATAGTSGRIACRW